MLCQALGLHRLNTVEVLHRTKAFGLVATHQDGWRLVYVMIVYLGIQCSQLASRYSGDTMPSESLVQAGIGATLLIHEATMGDDQEEMARTKAHSTISQAIDVAKRWEYKYITIPFAANEHM